MPSPTERVTRAAATVAFLLTGTVGAAWSTRIPAIQQDLNLTPVALSVAIVGLEFGAIVGAPLGGALVTRVGSRGGLRDGFIAYPVALVAVGAAPNLPALAIGLAVMAAANSVVDVAMNAQDVELERRYRRPVLSSMHAGHSAGLLTGGLAGTAAAGAGVPPVAHVAAAAAFAAVCGVALTRWLVSEPTARSVPTFARPGRPLMLLGAVAFCAFLLDGTAYNWIAVHLHTAHDASPALAATGFTLFTGALPSAA